MFNPDIDEDFALLPGGDGEWDEPVGEVISHPTYWNDFPDSEYRPSRTNYLTAKTRKNIIERDQRCQHCGSTDDMEVDHIFPVVFGGSDAESNLQVLCAPCNRAKGPKPHSRNALK